MNVEYYHLAKSLHIIAVISWMAGMLYLPRLYVYHSNLSVGSAASELFKIMERRLLRLIINPAMIAAWIFGVWLMMITGAMEPGNGWMHAKLGLVLLMSGVHGMLASYRKKFARDERPKSAKYFRIINEVPTVLMIAIVFLVVLKPF